MQVGWPWMAWPEAVGSAAAAMIPNGQADAVTDGTDGRCNAGNGRRLRQQQQQQQQQAPDSLPRHQGRAGNRCTGWMMDLRPVSGPVMGFLVMSCTTTTTTTPRPHTTRYSVHWSNSLDSRLPCAAHGPSRAALPALLGQSERQSDRVSCCRVYRD